MKPRTLLALVAVLALLALVFAFERRAGVAPVPTSASSFAPALPVSPSDVFDPPCASGDCDCPHFNSQAEAQDFYERHGPGDRHRLDRDRDGVACEML